LEIDKKIVKKGGISGFVNFYSFGGLQAGMPRAQGCIGADGIVSCTPVYADKAVRSLKEREYG